jgi:multidrug transporter EmrE-like cation transporter
MPVGGGKQVLNLEGHSSLSLSNTADKGRRQAVQLSKEIRTMHPTVFTVLSLAITYLVFGYLGYKVSKKFKRPVSLAVWIVMVVATFTCSFFSPGAMLIGGAGFSIHINEALQAIGIGIIIGLTAREIRIKFAAN